MLKERLQILVSTDQRRRLEREARRRGVSVGSVVRDAVDAQLGGVSDDDRRKAVDEILAMRAQYASPEEINRIAASEHDEAIEKLLRTIKQ